MEKKSSDIHPPKKNKKKPNPRRILKAIWIVFQVLIVLTLMTILFGGAAAAGFFASKVKDEPLRTYEEIYNELYSYDQTGEAYFKNNEFIGYLRSADVSQPITIDQVSTHLIDAILATEDNEFFHHEGVDIRGTARAILEELTNPGQGTGGSTITQQLVKYQILTSERKLERKFKEWLLAMRVERMFRKEQILEAYMNIVYLGFNANGSNVYGVGAGVEGIFDTTIKDINIPQAAYIAGMIQSPGRYTPFTRNGTINETGLENGIRRMNYVLGRMLETGRITQAEYEEAKKFDIRASLATKTPTMVEKYPFLTFEIERRATDILAEQQMKADGVDPDSLSPDIRDEYLDNARRQLSRGGYKVYTTIDRELYEALHETIANEDLFGPRSREHTYTYIDPETGEEKEQGYLEQTAATLIDNQTGAIIAMVEGRDFEEYQYNQSTVPRQPGSSIKPILDYGPAFELGILQPAAVLDDSPIFLQQPGGEYWVPRNVSRDYKGLVTVREALIHSYNLPAIKAFLKLQEEAGREIPFDFLKKMGITTLDPEDEAITAVAIGGMKYGLTVEESTGALSTFANKGIFLKPYLIERIETLDGELIYEHQVKPERVFSEQTAFLITDILRDVINRGTARTIRNGLGSKLDMAGKTGTTNDAYDSWFIGYTPQVSLGVWMGYPKLETLTQGYARRTQTIWLELMKTLKEVRPEYVNEELRFSQPDDIVRRTVCSKSGKLPSDLCREAGFLVDDYFNRAFIPTETDDVVVEERMIIVDDIRYIAQEKTPDDFVESGIFIKREPLDIPERYASQRERFLPRDWDTEAPTEVDPREENGKVPDPPSGLKVEWREDGLVVFWHPAPEDDLAGYRVYRVHRDGRSIHIASVPNHEPKAYTDEQVQRGEIVGYQVTAVDIAGQESSPTPIVFSGEQMELIDFFTPTKAPSAPNQLQATLQANTVELTWSINPVEEEVTAYAIYYTTDPINGFIPLAQTSINQYTHSTLPHASELFYYVTAINQAGESKESNVVKVNLPAHHQNGAEQGIPAAEEHERTLFDELP